MSLTAPQGEGAAQECTWAMPCQAPRYCWAQSRNCRVREKFVKVDISAEMDFMIGRYAIATKPIDAEGIGV